MALRIFILFCVLSLSGLGAETSAPKKPDYGRPEAPTPASEVLLWIPRVIFFPVHLVLEYGVRQPIGLLARSAEKGKWATQVISWFTFGPQEEAGVFPTALIDFGFKPSFGLYAFWKNLFVEKNRWTLQAGTGGKNYYRVTLSDRYEMNETTGVQLSLNLNHRPDWIFHGLGPDSNRLDRSRYALDRKEATVSYDKGILGEGALSVGAGIQRLKFSDGNCCGDPAISTEVGSGRYALPPGFGTGYTALYFEGGLSAGDKVFRPEGTLGGRMEARVRQANDISSASLGSWWRFGFDARGFISLSERWRQLWLLAQADFITEPAKGPAPFTEFPSLGGSKALPGFLEGRLLGQSTVSLTTAYTWPIWTFFDGIIHFGVGNAFGKGLDGFSLGRLRKSVGIGMRAIGGSGSAFQFQLAFGSDTFERGGDFNEFRIALGVSSAL